MPVVLRACAAFGLPRPRRRALLSHLDLPPLTAACLRHFLRLSLSACLLTQHDVELLSNRVERLREEERKAKQKVLETLSLIHI